MSAEIDLKGFLVEYPREITLPISSPEELMVEGRRLRELTALIHQEPRLAQNITCLSLLITALNNIAFYLLNTRLRVDERPRRMSPVRRQTTQAVDIKNDTGRPPRKKVNL